MKKLFVSWDGSEPECFEGHRLGECIGEMLKTYDVDDDNLEYFIEDISDFVSGDPLDEEGRIAKTFHTNMHCTAQWCYGYDTFEEAFSCQQH